MASQTAQGQVFIGPGLRPAKLILTMIGVLGITVLVLLIAIREGISAVGSTIVALLFIAGFLIYLRIVAPVPFTITLEAEALVKRSRNGEVIEVRWEELTRIKEEFFPNGKRISITAYRKPTSPIALAPAPPPIPSTSRLCCAGSTPLPTSSLDQLAKTSARCAKSSQKPKAWAVYRDDVTDIDGLAKTLKEVIPATCEWQSETVHE